MKRRIVQISALIIKHLANVNEKQAAKKWCDDDKMELNKSLQEFTRIHKTLKYDDRAIKRIIKREFGIEFGNVNMPFVKK